MSLSSTDSCRRATIHYREFDEPRARTLKRKLAQAREVPQSGTLPPPWTYPSPPMSSPPSPPQPSIYGPLTAARRASLALTTAAEGRITSFAPALATTLPAAKRAVYAPLLEQTGTSITGTNATASTTRSPLSSFQQQQLAQTAASTIGVASATTLVDSSSRGGRRSKSHVASACVNCKRAHLSCDVQRPCARCVASGKSDTCVDVQHKKRGRPRVREEGDPTAQQINAGQSSTQAAVAGPSQPSARPIAGTRHRRGESFRSLRSQTSEDCPHYSASTSGFSGHVPLQSSFGGQHPPASQARPSFEIATAFLNTDFAVLRANRPFENIMADGADIRGLRISELAESADGEDFLAIHNCVRAEREAREPAYMPPILQPDQNPVLGISEADADQYTQGFSDRTFTWRRTQRGLTAETFPVRIRLAKAVTYFVVVTLPSFRPVEPSIMHSPVPIFGGPLMVGPSLHGHPPQPPARPSAYQSAPPGAQYCVLAATAPMQPFPARPQLSTSRTYPPSQPRMPFQQPQYQYPIMQPVPQSTPRLMTAEPPTEATAFTPPSGPVQVANVIGTRALQLPPIAASPVGIPSGSQITHRTSSDEEEIGGMVRSPRKRRRMGIDDVLQR